MINHASKRRWLQGGGVIVVLLAGMALNAADASPVKGQRLNDSVSTNGGIQITGTVVIAPPCQVNNDKPVNVDFNTVRTDRIDNETYGNRSIGVSITCQSTPTSQLQLTLSGTQSPDKDSVLVTSIDGLGLRILRDGSDFALNTPVNVTKGDNFTLTAVPYSLDSKSLVPGDFTAVATLIVVQE